MTELVMSHLKHYRENTDEEFKSWYNFSTAIFESPDVPPAVP